MSNDVALVYERLNHRVLSVPELSMRCAVVEQAVRELPADVVVSILEKLIHCAIAGDSSAKEVLLAWVQWLLRLNHDEDYDVSQVLFSAAYERNATHVLMLFRNPPAHRCVQSSESLPEVSLGFDHQTTLGERCSLARTHERRLLERLLLDPSPRVVKNLLDNPLIQLKDVLQICSRRPTRPEIHREVVMHRRWFCVPDVRLASVLNPYSSTGVSLKLLPTVPIAKMRQEVLRQDLHPMVLEYANRLLTMSTDQDA